MPRLAHALCTLLDVLGIGEADVVGYSMGGRAALNLALVAKERVRRLVLIGATPGIESAAEREERSVSDLALAHSLEEEGIVAFVDRWENLPLFVTQRALPEAARARLREERLSHDPASLAASLRAFGTGFQTPVRDALSGITAPALLVVGERDRKFRVIAESMREKMPAAGIEIVAGAGHAVPSERPRELAAIMESFLSIIEAQKGREP